MDKILKLLNDNAHYSDADIAVMLGMEEKEVSEHIRRLEGTASYAAISRWWTGRRRTTRSFCAYRDKGYTQAGRGL